MTTAALKKEETKHIGRNYFSIFYKILFTTRLLIEPVKWGRKRTKDSTLRILLLLLITYLVLNFLPGSKRHLKDEICTYKLFPTTKILEDSNYLTKGSAMQNTCQFLQFQIANG